jgi:probable rRNA maturation factor
VRLRIFKETPSRLPRKKLALLFDRVVAGEAGRGWSASVNLVFTGDRQLRSLNRRFRKRDRATDVLAFTIDDPRPAAATFGEVYVSVDRARRQADEYGVSLTRELMRLTGHGLLHLFGWNHRGKAAAEKMARREDHYLKRAGG